MPMDTPEKITKWLQKMNYEGAIPANLKPICNTSTAFVWEQLIEKVKPRQDIQRIRNNILINRLKRNNETCNTLSMTFLKSEVKHSVKEIKEWERKRELEQQIKVVEERIRSARNKASASTMANSSKYLQLQNIKENIKKNRQEGFLASAKLKELEAECGNVQEMLTLVCNLSPKEEDSCSRVEVQEILEKCSEKLEKMIEKQELNETHLQNSAMLPLGTPYRDPFLSTITTGPSISKIEHSKQKPAKQESGDSLGVLDVSNMTFGNALVAAPFRDLTFYNAPLKLYELPTLTNEELNKLIETLFKNNRLTVWNIMCESVQKLKEQLTDIVVEDEVKPLSSTSTTVYRNETMLYATHLKYELKVRKIDLDVQELKAELGKVQGALFETLTDKNVSDPFLEHVKLQQTEAGLVGALEQAHELKQIGPQHADYESKLKKFTEEAQQVEDSIKLKVLNIQHSLNAFHQVHEATSQARTETVMMARKLELFTHDLGWTLPLAANVTTARIKAVLNLPLEYNRAIRGGGGGGETTYVRDLPLNRIPYQEEFDSNSVHVLGTILGNPSGFEGAILKGLLRKMERVDRLAGLVNREAVAYSQIGVSVDLQAYHSHLLEKIRSVVREGPAALERMSANIQESMNLWLEMPFGRFISETRLFNEANYEYYEKMFDSYYKKLP